MQLNSRPRVTLAEIPDGVDGTRATLIIMRQLARDGKRDYRIRELALSLVHDLPNKDRWGEVLRLHQFVRDRIRYVGDIDGIETIATPDQTLRIGQGDCDDKAVLLAALLLSIGHPARFIAFGRRPNQFSHVLTQTRIRGKQHSNWISLETTEPVRAGWAPPDMPYTMIETV